MKMAKCVCGHAARAHETFLGDYCDCRECKCMAYIPNAVSMQKTQQTAPKK
jgi:hypothetical protein